MSHKSKHKTLMYAMFKSSSRGFPCHWEGEEKLWSLLPHSQLPLIGTFQVKLYNPGTNYIFMTLSSSHIKFFSVSLSLQLRRLTFCRKISSPHACCISHKSHCPYGHIQYSVQSFTFFCIYVNVRSDTSRSHDCSYY